MTGQSSIQHWFSPRLDVINFKRHHPYFILHTDLIIFLHLIIVTIFHDEYKLWISPLYSFLQPPVTSSLVQIFPSAPCCQTPSVYVLHTVCEPQSLFTQNTQNYRSIYFLSLFLESNGDTKVHAMNGSKHSSNKTCSSALWVQFSLVSVVHKN